MLIGKGPRQVSENLVDLLLECHQRIRSFAKLARTVAAQPNYASDEVVEACQGITRYFSEALPLHVDDEEQSILPRLFGKRPEVDEALVLMQSQHQSHQRPLAQLVALCGDLAQPSARATELGAELCPLSESVERELITHLELEESVIFPAITAHLSVDEQAAIVRELRARRQSTLRPPLDH